MTVAIGEYQGDTGAIGEYQDDWEERRVAAFGPAPLPQPIPSFQPSDRLLPPSFSLPTSDFRLLTSPCSRPQLAAPRARNPFLDLADLAKEIEDLQRDDLAFAAEQTKALAEEQRRLDEEKMKALQEHSREVATKETWSFWANIAGCFTSAGMLAVGIGLKDTIAGVCMIGSAALGLANELLHRIGAWSGLAKWFTNTEEKQNEVAQWIYGGVSVLSLGLGIGSGFAAYKTGALALANTQLITKIGEAISLGGTALSTTTNLIAAIAQRKALLLKVYLEKLAARRFEIAQEIRDIGSGTKSDQDLTSGITDELKGLIS